MGFPGWPGKQGQRLLRGHVVSLLLNIPNALPINNSESWKFRDRNAVVVVDKGYSGI